MALNEGLLAIKCRFVSTTKNSIHCHLCLQNNLNDILLTMVYRTSRNGIIWQKMYMYQMLNKTLDDLVVYCFTNFTMHPMQSIWHLYTNPVKPSIHPSIHPSHSWTLSKKLNTSLNGLKHLVASSFKFLTSNLTTKFYQEPWGVVWKFWYSTNVPL